MGPTSSKRAAPEIAAHPYGQIWRRRDQRGRLVRIELRSPAGTKAQIVASFDWTQQTGERKATGPNVHLGYFYYSGAEHVHTTWDDEPPGGGVPMSFEQWVQQVEDEFERRARTGR